jgi:hypothetical protein
MVTVAGADLAGFPGVAELLGGVLADGFQQPVPGRRLRLLRRHQ